VFTVETERENEKDGRKNTQLKFLLYSLSRLDLSVCG